MTTRITTSIAAGVAALALAAAVPAFVAAQDQPRRGPGVGGPMGPGPGGPGMRMRGPGGPGGPGGPMGFGPGFRGLDLSDEQKAQLKQIADSHQDEFKAAGEKARAAHEGMRTLMDAEAIDESAIRAKSQEVAAAQAEVMILNAKVRKESMQVLTADQLATLKERRDARPFDSAQGRPDGPRPRRQRGQ